MAAACFSLSTSLPLRRRLPSSVYSSRIVGERFHPSSLCRCGPSPSHSSSDAPPNSPSSSLSQRGISSYTWCAGLGALGFAETGYLTYLKLFHADAFCVTPSGSCGEVLNSRFSYVFGIPLPLIGMVAYGLVSLLGFQQAGKNALFGLSESYSRMILLGTTTSMATASAYFLYLLYTKFSGTSCLYCLISAFLSFSLFIIVMKNIGLEEFQKVIGLQLALASVVMTALTYSFMVIPQQISSSNDILDPFPTEITKGSSAYAISLAKHLHSIGAKMYGAFWCSHCNEQKELFGREAAKLLEYVECYPDGSGNGREMAKECATAGIEGFPAWIIKGQVINGLKALGELAQASGFVNPKF